MVGLKINIVNSNKEWEILCKVKIYSGGTHVDAFIVKENEGYTRTVTPGQIERVLRKIN